jgi:hypothetical protein
MRSGDFAEAVLRSQHSASTRPFLLVALALMPLLGGEIVPAQDEEYEFIDIMEENDEDRT